MILQPLKIFPSTKTLKEKRCLIPSTKNIVYEVLDKFPPKFEIYLIFPYFLVYYTRCQVSFHLWRIEPMLKHCNVPKYYDQDCRCSIGSTKCDLIRVGKKFRKGLCYKLDDC